MPLSECTDQLESRAGGNEPMPRLAHRTPVKCRLLGPMLLLAAGCGPVDGHSLSITVSAEHGSDACLQCVVDGCACGTPARPVASLMAAQRLADAFVERERAGRHDTGASQRRIHVEIVVSGEFYGQWFRWRHAHREVALTLRGARGERAVFHGSGHPCQTTRCVTDERPTAGGAGAPTFEPIRCDSSEYVDALCIAAGRESAVGYTFFAAPGQSVWFHDHHRDYSGFGAIHIEDIEVREYHTAIRVAGWSAADVRRRAAAGTHDDAVDSPAEGMFVGDCRFERIGEIANNEASDDPLVSAMSDAYTAIALFYVDDSVFRDNAFADIVNYGNWLESKILMHAVYTKLSDQNTFVGNTFVNVSGQPIKFRNSSDRNLVVGNVFEAGRDSVTRVPVQDWYCDWQDLGGRSECARMELPSFENTLRENTYLGGYVSDPREERPEVIAIACPSHQADGGSYRVMQTCAATPNRMVVEGIAIACIEDTDDVVVPVGINSHLLRGRTVPITQELLAREVCSPARCEALVAAAGPSEDGACPLRVSTQALGL